MHIQDGKIYVGHYDPGPTLKNRIIKIFATDKDGNKFEIENLYWFKENFVTLAPIIWGSCVGLESSTIIDFLF